MKKIIVLMVLLWGALAFAQSPYPREHRGIYFSAGLGGQYISQVRTIEEIEDDVYYHDPMYSNYVIVDREKHFEKQDYSGFSIPALELKLGRSVGNLLSMYFIMDLAIYNIGRSEFSSSVEAEGHTIKKTSFKENDAPGASSYMGFGFDVFPFRNPNSPLNGLYIGTSFGPLMFTARMKGDAFDFSLISFIEQIEIGKHWWINDTWSVGASLSFAWCYASLDEDDYEEVSVNKLQFMIKIIRG